MTPPIHPIIELSPDNLSGALSSLTSEYARISALFAMSTLSETDYKKRMANLRKAARKLSIALGLPANHISITLRVLYIAYVQEQYATFPPDLNQRATDD